MRQAPVQGRGPAACRAKWLCRAIQHGQGGWPAAPQHRRCGPPV